MKNAHFCQIRLSAIDCTLGAIDCSYAKFKIWRKISECNRFHLESIRLLQWKLQNLVQNQWVQSIAPWEQSIALVQKWQKCSVGWMVAALAQFLHCQRRHGNKHMNLGVSWVIINQKILENSRLTQVWLLLTELWLCLNESFFGVFDPNLFLKKLVKEKQEIFFWYFGLVIYKT